MTAEELIEMGTALQATMKIELKKFTANEKFSEETLMFRADIYIDGKRAGSVENEGRGGPSWPHFDDAEVGKRVAEYVKTLPPMVSDYDAEGNLAAESGKPPEQYPESLDSFFSGLAEKAQRAKEDARISKKFSKLAAEHRSKGLVPWKFSFRDARNESYVVIGLKPDESPTPHGARLAAKYKAVCLGSEELP